MHHCSDDDLPRRRAAHLRWLAAHFGSSCTIHDLEEILQDAYEEALLALRGVDPPVFASSDAREAWFRRLLRNTAIDTLRARRPTLSLEDDEPLTIAADDDAERDLVLAAERAHVGRAIRCALEELPEAHARILVWRYIENLEPRAIMARERWATIKVYEGRLTRAVKALGHALAGMRLDLGCSRARLLLEQRPELLLERGAGESRVHLDVCRPCQAFRRQLRGALAALPVPAVVAAVPPASPAPPKPSLLEALLSQPKLAAALLAGAVATGGGVAGAAAAGSSAPAPPSVSRASVGAVPEPPGVPFSDAAAR